MHAHNSKGLHRQVSLTHTHLVLELRYPPIYTLVEGMFSETFPVASSYPFSGPSLYSETTEHAWHNKLTCTGIRVSNSFGTMQLGNQKFIVACVSCEQRSLIMKKCSEWD